MTKEKLAQEIERVKAKNLALRKSQRDAAMRRFKDKPLKDRSTKPVTTLAGQISMLPGGMKEFHRWMRAAGLKYKEYQEMVKSYFEFPPWRQHAVELQALCHTMGLNWHEFLGACVTVASEHNVNCTRYIASLAMPAVMKRNIEEAKKPKGVEDRKMFMMSTGILPVAKGSTINVLATSQAAAITTSGEPTGLPAFEDSTVSFSEIIRQATEAPQALPEPVDVVPVEDD